MAGNRRLTWITILPAILLSLCASPVAPAEDDNSPLVVEGLRLINGTQIFCKSIGTGIPLVILHGGPGLDHSYFLPQMEKLADTYELIFFDQRGCGKSSIRVDTAAMTLDGTLASMMKWIDVIR